MDPDLLLPVEHLQAADKVLPQERDEAVVRVRAGADDLLALALAQVRRGVVERP